MLAVAKCYNFNRMNRGEEGFTIIEVSLFLAVSALILVSLVFGMRFMISRMHFSDAMNSTTSWIQTQFEEVRSGMNANQGTTLDLSSLGCNAATGGTTSNAVSGTSNCLMIGKLLVMNPSGTSTVGSVAASQTITAYYVVATAAPANLAGDDNTAIQNLTLQVVGSASQSFLIPWGDGVAQAFVDNSAATPTSFNQVAILRSPVSNGILAYYLKRTGTTGSLTGLGTPSQSGVILLGNQDSGYNGGAICLSGGTTAADIRAHLPISTSPNSNFSATTLGTVFSTDCGF